MEKINIIMRCESCMYFDRSDSRGGPDRRWCDQTHMWVGADASCGLHETPCECCSDDIKCEHCEYYNLMLETKEN